MTWPESPNGATPPFPTPLASIPELSASSSALPTVCGNSAPSEGSREGPAREEGLAVQNGESRVQDCEGSVLEGPEADLDFSVTHRPGAKALARSPEGGVLLGEECRGDGSTFWTLPGGGLESGESHEACLCREVREELDSEATVGAPIAVCSYRHTSRPATRSRYIVFQCTIDDPVPVRTEGVVGLRWVHPSSPPAGTLDPFRQLLESLARCP